MNAPHILFICKHDDVLSRMAAGFARRYGAQGLQVHSAGLAPTRPHPITLAVLAEVDVWLEETPPTAVEELLAQGMRFDHVVQLCPDQLECPAFAPATGKEVTWHHWHLPETCADPLATPDLRTRLAAFRSARDVLMARVRSFVRTLPCALASLTAV